MIETSVDRVTGVTSALCHGKLSVTEISDWVKNFYSEGPTPFILWDLGEADPSSITSAEVHSLAESLPAMEHSRKGGRTALVSRGDLSYGMTRMYEVFATQFSTAAEVRSFRTTQEAHAWLLSKDEA